MRFVWIRPFKETGYQRPGSLPCSRAGEVALNCLRSAKNRLWK